MLWALSASGRPSDGPPYAIPPPPPLGEGTGDFEPFPSALPPQGRQLQLDTELFAGYAMDEVPDGETFDEFFLERAQVGVRGRWTPELGAELRLEAVRAATPDSVVGVDGDSLVMRVKRARVSWQLVLLGAQFRVEGGLAPDIWIETLERAYRLRGVASTLVQRGGFSDQADLGVIVGAQLFSGKLRLMASLTNGEGRNEREQNSGKNATVVASVKALTGRLWGGPLDVSLHGMYRSGSRGVGLARDDRLGGAVTVLHPRVGLGVAYTAADGYAGRATLEATALESWLEVVVSPRLLGLFGRFDQWDPAAQDAALDATRNRITGGVFTHVAGSTTTLERVRLYVFVQQDAFGTDAGPVPGVGDAGEFTRYGVSVEVRGARDISR
ncbi:MAG: hypothetical protein ACE366_20645 [Bradymonadia bacterium]